MSATLVEDAPEVVTSGCITGKPCALGCSLFCALEPTDASKDESGTQGGA